MVGQKELFLVASRGAGPYKRIMQGEVFEPGLSKNPSLVSKLREFQENPASLVFVALAEEYRKLGFPQQALEIINEGLQFHPDLLGAWLVESRALMDQKRYAEALARTAQILQRSPEHVRAMQLRADIFIRLGQSNAAINILRRLAFLFPQDKETQSRIIELEALNPVVKNKDDTAEIQSAYVSRSAASRGKLADYSVGALKDLREAGADDFFIAQGEQDAVETLDETFATRTIAELYMRQGLREKAIEVLKRIREKNPQDAWVNDALLNVGANSTFPINPNKVVLDRQTSLTKKAQYLERALARIQLSVGSGRSFS